MAEDRKTGLAYLLSLEKMPRRPALRGPTPVVELENWIEGLENYLRRLFGLFTADNILITIIQGGGGVAFLDKMIKFVTATTGEVSIIDEDCRGQMLLFWVSWPTSIAGDLDASQWSTWTLYQVWLFGKTWSPGADAFMVSTTTNQGTIFEIDIDKDDGHIKLIFDSTGTAVFPDGLRIGILKTPRKIVPDLII